MERLYRLDRLVRFAPIEDGVDFERATGRDGGPNMKAGPAATRLQRARDSFNLTKGRRRHRDDGKHTLEQPGGNASAGGRSGGGGSTAAEATRQPRRTGKGFAGLGMGFMNFGLGSDLPEDMAVDLCAIRTLPHRTVVVTFTTNEYLVFTVRDAGRAPAVRMVAWFGYKEERIKALCLSPRGEFCIAVTHGGQIYSIPVLHSLAFQGAAAAVSASAAKHTTPASPPPAARSRTASRPRSRASGLQQHSSSQQPPPRRPDEDVGSGLFGRRSSNASSLRSTQLQHQQQQQYGLQRQLSASVAGPVQFEDDLPASTTDLTMCGTYRVLRHSASRCVWWTPHTGRPTLIVGTTSGQLHFADILAERVVHTLTIRPRTTITHVAVQQHGQWAQSVVVQAGDRVFSCVIQREEESDDAPSTAAVRQPVSVMDRDLREPVLPFPIVTSYPLAPVETTRAYPLVCLHNSASAYVFPAEGQSKALNSFRLPAGTVALAATDNLTFAVTQSKGEPARLMVCSNLLCTTTPHDNHSQDHILQQFSLGSGERVVSVTPLAHGVADVGCVIVTTTGVYECHQVTSPSFFCLQLLRAGRNVDVLAATMKVDLAEVYRIRAEELFHAREYTRSFYHFVRASTDELDLIARFARAGQMFLVAQSLRQQLSNQSALPGPLRKRLAGLMLLTYMHLKLTLPEPEPEDHPVSTPASRQTKRPSARSLRQVLSSSVSSTSSGGGIVGSGGAALELTRTTRSSSLKFTDQHETQSLSVGALDRVLTAREVTESLQAFITDNWDYDFRTALSGFLRHGMFLEFFQAAHARGKVNIALAMPVNRSVIKFHQDVLDFLLARDYSDLFCEYSKGVLLRCLSPEQLVDVLLSRPTHIHPVASIVTHLLPVLSERTLLKLLHFLNPTRPAVRYVLERGRRLNAPRFSGRTPSSAGTAPSTPGRDSGFGSGRDADERDADRDIVHAYLRLLVAYNRALLQRTDGYDAMRKRAPWFVHLNTWMDILSGDFSSLHALRPALVPAAHNDESELLVTTGHLDDGAIDCGIQHSAAVVQGDVYTWGKAVGGRLGQGAIVEDAGEGSIMRVETLHMHGIKVLGVACGAEHTVVRTNKGIFAWGENDLGQLGLGHKSRRSQPEMVVDLKGTRVDHVVCGHFHTFAMSGTDVWGWGANTYGQLGVSYSPCIITPHSIPDLSRRRLVALSAGATHTVALSADGKVFSCGCGLFGQLMLGDLPTRQAELRRVPIEDPVRLIACGPYQTAVVTVAGALLFAGRSLLDRKPIPTDHRSIREQRATKPHPAVLKPVRIAVPPALGPLSKVRIALHHMLLLGESGRVAAIGAGDCGVLGCSATEDEHAPRLIDSLPQIEHIGVGETFSLARDVTGQVWAWGRGDSGELGAATSASEDTATPFPLQNLPAVADSRVTDDDGAADAEGATNTSLDQSQQQPMLNSLTRGNSISLPDFSVVSPAFGGWCIPVTLVELANLYSPSTALRVCEDAGDRAATAAVAALLGNYEDALYNALTALRSDFYDRLSEQSRQRASPMAEAARVLVARFVDMHMSDESNKKHVDRSNSGGGDGSDHRDDGDRLEGLKRILAVAGYFFEDAALPLHTFTQLLTDACANHPSVLVSLVVEAHHHNAAGTSPSDIRLHYAPSSIFLHLQQDVCVAAARNMFKKFVDESQHGDLAQLWGHMLSNVSSELPAALQAIHITHVPDDAETAAPGHATTVYFTCGHQYASDDFLGSILPAFTDRIEALNKDLSTWLSVIRNMYLQKKPQLACPLCLFAHVRQAVLARHPTAIIAPWTKWP